MKAVITALIAFSLTASFVGHAAAARHKKRQHYENHHSKQYRARPYGYREPRANGSSDGYYEHVLDKVPFGSQRWWTIYFEQHGTPR